MATLYKDSKSKSSTTKVASHGSSTVYKSSSVPKTKSHVSQGVYSNKFIRPRSPSQYQQSHLPTPAPSPYLRTMKPLVAVAGGIFILTAGLNKVAFDSKNSKPEPIFVETGIQTSTQIQTWNPLGNPSVSAWSHYADGSVPLPQYMQFLQTQAQKAQVNKRKADFRATVALNAQKRAVQRDTRLADRAVRLKDRAITRGTRYGSRSPGVLTPISIDEQGMMLMEQEIAKIVVDGYPTVDQFPISAIDTAAITVMTDTVLNDKSPVGETGLTETETGTGSLTGIEQFLDTLSPQDLEKILNKINEIVDENNITEQDVKKTYSSYYTIAGVILGVGAAVAVAAATGGTAAIPALATLPGMTLSSGSTLAYGTMTAVEGTKAFVAYSALSSAVITPAVAAAGASATTIAAAAAAGGVVGGVAGAASGVALD